MKIIINSLILTCLLISILLLNSCKKDEKNIPVLITVPAISIKATTAIMGGQIAYDGGSDITERGACWGTEQNPDLSGSKTTGGKGTGNYKCMLRGLNPGTLYYARAYATNSKGTAYGGEVRFTTGIAGAPTVVTIADPTQSSYYGATIGLNITYDGGAPVTEKGVCWGANENPTIVDNEKITNTDRIDTIKINYMCYISPLTPSTVYHTRAYAINAAGISYGNDKTITTLSLPEVSTLSPTSITNNSAAVSGNLISKGDAVNFETGICYATSPNPTYYSYHVNGGTTETGEYTSNLTGLVPGTVYYARAYVYWLQWDRHWNAEFAVYGNEVTFTTKTGSGK